MLYELKYTNELNQEIVFGGLKYGFVDTNEASPSIGGIYLNAFEGFGDVTADIQSQKAPFQDGSTHIDTLLEERTPHIEFTFVSNDFNELSNLRRRINRVFNPKVNGRLELSYGEKTYVLNCTPEHVPIYADDGLDARGHVQIGMLDLIALEPFWKSLSITEEPAFESMFEFPSIPYWKDGADGDLYFEMGMQRTDRVIDNDSDTPIPIQIDFYGPADSPMIENETTGEYIRINKRLEENEIFKVDTTDGVKSVIYVDEEGNETNVFHWIDLGSTFFKLQMGENDITCNCAVSNNEKDFDIYYQKQYVGV